MNTITTIGTGIRSATLVLILDDIELGTALTRLAVLFFQAGDINQGIQTRVDAEECYTRAERTSVRLSIEDQEKAARSIKMLRSEINCLSEVKCSHRADLTAKDFAHTISSLRRVG